MIEKISALRNQVNERAVYYSNIGFVNLANEFTNVKNILNEIEAIAKENDELRAQIQALEAQSQTHNTSAESGAHSSDILIGCIKQSEGDARQ